MELDRLKIAYEKWRMHQPDWDRSCCNHRHHYGNGIIKPDNLVCEREKAWREYVRLRDYDSGFMTGYRK